MFAPRAMHVLPPVVTDHVKIANKVDRFYKEYIHWFQTEKGIATVLKNARENRWRDKQVRVAYRRALAKWGRVREEVTQALYKEVFGKKS